MGHYTIKLEARRVPWTMPPQSATRLNKLDMPWNFPNEAAIFLYSSVSFFPSSSREYLPNMFSVEAGSRYKRLNRVLKKAIPSDNSEVLLRISGIEMRVKICNDSSLS